MDVSIIIVNYNTSELTINAINSIFEQTKGVDFEVIVVDNNSPDAKCSKISEQFHHLVKLVELPSNIGFGRANNEGFKVAYGRNILFLNPDTLLRTNAVKILSDFVDQNSRCGVCGGNLFSAGMEPAASFGMIYYSVWFELNRLFLFLPSMVLYGKNMWFNHTGKVKKVAHIVGADMMIRANVFQEIGGFDPGFFMYCEETELCKRIRNLGYSIYSVPQAEIIHLEGRSFDVRESRELRFLEGRKVYYAKRHSKRHYKVANLISTMAFAIRWLVYLVLAKKKMRVVYATKLQIFIDFIYRNKK